MEFPSVHLCYQHLYGSGLRLRRRKLVSNKLAVALTSRGSLPWTEEAQAIQVPTA